ncbi:hypothetical protein F3J16_05185 [Burkholderia sp. Ap-962]|uniref:hypothetical protein n=1 Tax=Burkholderia sp. Ap-962 TaxID=2608333 RepID=UPI001423FD7D|nr:hypothetical protein [Burkholderia sp. Ap-962]NIF69589.1 hypothetical protein [Burkholderia sp. Ap-962]
MTAKSFLLQECENIKAVLEETLRFKYGISGSKDFYDECNTRLAFITSEINATDEGDKIALATNLGLLLELSKLISRIERSSLGQYSWPFVDELKKIAFAICAEETLDDPETPPMVHVLSEGGLDSYAIFPEQQRPSAGKRRILTIVFPRTLKHFVLLHSILGHEIGHAMWRSSKHQAELRQALHDAFVVSNGKFSSQQATIAWIYDQNAPAEIRTQLTNLAAHGLQQQFFFQWANWEAWKEEILCDLIGILTFGPSFIAAECNLLYSLDLTGVGIGTAHPPVGCRVNLFLMASRILGYREIQFPDHDLQAAYDRFWEELETYVKQDPWFNIFTENEIRTALDRIGAILGAHPPAAYMAPSLDLLADLFRQLQSAVPPIGFKLVEGKNPSAYSVDFRHILYAGWLASKGNQDIKFPDLNRLCEHAIMQQRAIDIFNCQQG